MTTYLLLGIIGILAAILWRETQKNFSLKIELEKSRAESRAASMLPQMFENISHKIFEEQSAKLTQKNGEILKPLQDKIEEFKRQNQEDKGILKTQLESLKSAHTNLSKNAEDLTMALKGGSKIQGDWGEAQLKNLLDMSGLREGINYKMQQSFSKDGGGADRPDCIVNLPDGKRVVVDSKVSLTDFLNYVGAEDESTRRDYLKRHAASIKRHIDELGTKEYQKLLKSESLDFVFMFIPNEPAYIEALRAEPALNEYAYKSNVAIATPSSLLPILRTIQHLWNIEKQNENAEVIAEKAGALYDKLAGAMTTFKTVGNALDSASKNYATAVGQLYDGRGSAYSIAEEMKQKGAVANKEIPLLKGENV